MSKAFVRWVQRLPERSILGSGNCEQLLKGFRFRVQGKIKAQIESAKGVFVGSETA